MAELRAGPADGDRAIENSLTRPEAGVAAVPMTTPHLPPSGPHSPPSSPGDQPAGLLAASRLASAVEDTMRLMRDYVQSQHPEVQRVWVRHGNDQEHRDWIVQWIVTRTLRIVTGFGRTFAEALANAEGR